MEKIKKVLNDFRANVKEYVEYLMKVDFKELFVNTVILLCLVVLAFFVYIPISVAEDLLYSFFTIFISFNKVAFSLYSWVFKLLSFLVAFYAFMILFNMRFSDVKKQKTEGKVIVKNNDKKESAVEMELPKAKKDK